MTIQQLIEILQKAPDKNAKVWIESKNTDFTNNIDVSFDDLNDIQIFEVSPKNENKSENQKHTNPNPHNLIRRI